MSDHENTSEVADSGVDRKKEKRLKQKMKKMEKTDENGQNNSENSKANLETAKMEPEKQKPSKTAPAASKSTDKKGAAPGKKGAPEPKKGPSKKAIAAMQETLKKIKEEEEKARLEEEERIRKLEELEKARLLEIEREKERKEKKKQKHKERKEKLKAEGKLLTAKQRQDRARAMEMLQAFKAQAAAQIGASKAKETKSSGEESSDESENEKNDKENHSEKSSESVAKAEEKAENKVEATKVAKDEVIDSWDMYSSDENENDKVAKNRKAVAASKVHNGGNKREKIADIDTDTESSSESSESQDEERHDDDTVKEKVRQRIFQRQEAAEAKKSADNLRAAVVCVLGHVDTGKTKILDKLRRTHVQDSEAGGITQQIGATNVPIEAIKEQIRIVKDVNMNVKVPGLLIIDTPGHESFSNLRNRGSSLCDIAILVVDIMHGLEQQTIESISILKSKKVPFVVALNKIDRLYNWNTMIRKDVREIINAQEKNTQLEFDKRSSDVIVQFSEQGLNAALFYKNPDPRSYVSLVPTSAITGEGMGNLLALIVESCQNMLTKRLMFSEELQATVLEVKAIPGLGTTVDVILMNGYLREGETMVLAGTEGPIVTQIRSLLMPQPLKELRVKNAYQEFKEIKAAQGVKIAAKDLEKTVAGINLRIARSKDEIPFLKEEVSRELHSALSTIKLQDRGVYVQASTLGSLEALLEFLRTSKIPYSNIRIGPVVRKDVMKASVMIEHDPQYATILAFDVKVERDAQEMADQLGVKIFQADIIYHLFDKFTQYQDDLKAKKRDEFKDIAVFPCKLRILPQCVYNSRDPIVCGVHVEGGIVKIGTPLCVPTKEFINVGVVTSVESNHKQLENARKGQEVAIKIENVPGETPKLFGRHFDENDLLVSKISRQSIDACKDYFRDDLLKSDWQLMVELKKQFEIL